LAPPAERRGSRQQFEAIRNFRRKLAEKKVPLIGIGVQMTDITSTDALADCSDFIWYDTEHVPFSPEVLKWHIIAAHGKGCPAIVRVPGPNRVDGVGLPWGIFIKHALDSNADGIAVPQVRTAADVRSIVADCRYPTGGQRTAPFHKAQGSTLVEPNRFSRGFGPTTPMNYGRIPLTDYLEAADTNIFVCAMIETVEALENIEDICSVPGLDCVILGANDLSGALGVPYQGNSKETISACDKIIDCAKRHGKYVFFSTRYPEAAKQMADKGVQIIHIGHDILAAVSYQEKLVSDLKVAC
jgi:4-hydroxy-2-oxoheptanedioate aldolase